MAESLQSLADRGIQIGPGGQQYSATGPGGQYQPVSGGGSQAPALQQLPQGMTLQDAQSQANQAFSGLVAPMTLEQIRTREAEAKALTSQTADAVYDPNISREKQIGAAGVSTAEGVVGQRQGFNISTAEQAFVADVQNKVQDRVREVEGIKANYIAQGNMAAADRADNQLQALNEWNSQMTIAKAEYALKLMAGSRDEARLGLEQARFGLEQRSQEFGEKMANENLAINIAGLTGEYQGSPTFAANQTKIENAFRTADITGYYNGTKTLAMITGELQRELEKEGIQIERERLAETIRSNMVQEGLARSKASGSGGKTDTNPAQYTNEVITRLVQLRDSGQLTDANYRAEVALLADNVWGLDITDPNQWERAKQLANQAMQGGGGNQPETSVPTPAPALQQMTTSTQAGAAIKNFMLKGGILPGLMGTTLELGGVGYNFMSGLLGGRGMSRAEINEVKAVLTKGAKI